MRAPVLLVFLLLASSLFAAEIPISQPGLVPLEPMLSASAPALAAGAGLAVVWSETIGYSENAVVRIRTYEDDGTPRQLMSVNLGSGHTPRVFWNGSEYIVVFAPSFSRFGAADPRPAIVVRRVRPDGTIVPGEETLATARSGATVIAVAWDGTNALAAVVHNNADHLLLLDRQGRLLTDTIIDYRPSSIAVKPAGGFFILPETRGLGVAAGGDRFAFIGHIVPGGVFAAIADREGRELERFTLSDVDSYATSGIVWDGRAWIAAYGRHGSLCTARFTSAVDVTKSCGSGGSTYAAALAIGARGLFKAWTDGRQVMTDAGLASTEFSTVGGSDAVVDEKGILAAWIETMPGGAQIRIGGINDDGTARPEHGVPLPIELYDDVRFATAGQQTLLVWSQSNRMYGTMVGEEDQLIQFRDGSHPAVVARGEEWLIVWESPTGIETEHMNRDRQVTALEQCGSTAQQFTPAIAATAAGYLVAWAEYEDGVNRLVVEPLNAEGRRAVGGNRIVERQAPIMYPAIGCGPSTCLVTWYGETGEIWSTVVRHDGTKISADRVFETNVKSKAVIDALPDGSFLVYRGGAVTPVSATNEPGVTQYWATQPVALGNVVTWHGHRTAVYARRFAENASRLFAFEFASRGRPVRH